jgi:large subunit ribosomal protein L15e
MGYLKYVKKLWESPKNNMKEEYKQYLYTWRRENVITRLERPTRIDRARGLGYKAKQGFVMVRVRINRGNYENPTPSKGRDGGNNTRKKNLAKNKQWICEEKAQRRYPNLEVLNAYWVGQDENHKWYEVILVDPYHPSVLACKSVNWIISNKQTKRVFRGKTSAGLKSR